jgi:rhodanese-related sulfurtransferase
LLYFIDSTVKELIKEDRIEMPTDIHRNDVQRLVASGAQLVEVLPAEEYNEAHLPGAMNIPLKKLNKQSIKPLDPSRPVIVYCNDFQ